MPTMLNRLLHITIFLVLAATAGAQYLPGKLQGGSGVPGTQSRSPLNSLERAANNLPGITIVTDTFGNQRWSYYVRVLDTCVNYNPLLTVGNLPISSFVYQCGDNDSLFYIDWKSDVVLISIGGGPSCDADWLDIVTNDCPDNINDSIYTQKYAAIGARLVWPTAELLVSDSSAVQVTVLSGNRNSRLGFWDNVNQFGSTIDQSGAQTLWYIEPTGEMRWATAGSGTVQAPGAPFVNQFAINPADAPLPTVQAHLYPNTRTDTNTIRNFIYTDGSGKLRSQSIDSLAQILIDSAFIVTIYSGDDTTASTLRTVHILESLQFTDLDAGGYFLVQMGSLAGGRALIDTAAAIYHSGLGGINIVQADAQGIDIATSATASRAVNLTTDTVNTQGSFDPQNFRLNFLSDYSYLYADSLKVVGIGQFPDFPNLNFDGTEKGILYNMSDFGVGMLNGDGASGQYAYSVVENDGIVNYSDYDGTGQRISNFGVKTSNGNVYISCIVSDINSPYASIQTYLTSSDPNMSDNYFSISTLPKDTNILTATILGQFSTDRRHWGVYNQDEGEDPFYFLQCFLPNDTTENALSFFNRAYYWKNEHPIGAAGDTLLHFWAATGPGGEAGKDPGFMSLDDVCGHCLQQGTFNADMLSWSAGGAGDFWEAVPANRTSIATTSASLIPSISTAEILIDGTGGGTVELNYTPDMPAAGYTTVRYIYNATAGSTTVDTDQAWEYRDSTGDLGSSFSLAAGENCKLIWIYNATAADARFFVIKF